MADDETMTIGQLAERTGCKVPTIRHYEAQGLLPEPPRTIGNRRVYGPSHLDILLFVRRGRDLGFSLAAIGDLLRLGAEPGRACDAATRIAERHLAEVERKIAQLHTLRDALRTVIDRCDNRTVDDCEILKSLHGSVEPGRTIPSGS